MLTFLTSTITAHTAIYRTTLVDNNTWNNSHIALVGKAMASNEDDAYKIMQDLDVDYVLGKDDYRTHRFTNTNYLEENKLRF